jgi:hypothetical protein
MEFLKNHYEKVLLSFVLLALAVAAALLPMDLQDPGEAAGGNKIAFKFDPQSTENIIKQLAQGSNTILSGAHNLFNPVLWKKMPDGTLVKYDSDDQIGPKAMKVTDIRPLCFVLILDEIIGSADNRTYAMKVTTVNPPDGKRGSTATNTTTKLLQMGDSTDQFTLLEAKPADNPTDVVVKLTKTGEKVEVSKGKPFIRKDDYTADLKYDPENKVFKNMRLKDTMVFEGETNNIVDISQNEVVLLTQSTTLRTTLKYKK